MNIFFLIINLIFFSRLKTHKYVILNHFHFFLYISYHINFLLMNLKILKLVYNYQQKLIY